MSMAIVFAMNNKTINDAREALEVDLESAPYILNDGPLGHAVTQRKIYYYLYTCVKEGEDKVNCRDWLFELYKAMDEKHMFEFQGIIHAVTDALYEYDKFLKK